MLDFCNKFIFSSDQNSSIKPKLQKPRVKHFPLSTLLFLWLCVSSTPMGFCFVFCNWCLHLEKWLINGIFKPPTKHWLKPLDLLAATAFHLLYSVLPTLQILPPTEPAISLRKDKLERKNPNSSLFHHIVYNIFIIEIKNKK